MKDERQFIERILGMTKTQDIRDAVELELSLDPPANIG